MATHLFIENTQSSLPRLSYCQVKLSGFQGFQLIVEGPCSHTIGSAGSVLVGPRPQDIQLSKEYKLSIGRVFHRIVLNGSEIGVTRYRPRWVWPGRLFSDSWKLTVVIQEFKRSTLLTFNGPKAPCFLVNLFWTVFCLVNTLPSLKGVACNLTKFDILHSLQCSSVNHCSRYLWSRLNT